MPAGLLLSDDLIFASRIRAVAAAHGVAVTTVRTPAELLARVEMDPPTCVILDANLAGLALEDLCGRLKRREPTVNVVAYGSHVDAATLRVARDAGCDVVLPRSKFVEELEAALPTWLGVTPSA
jgi:CheY-like chemotaxis protein